MHRQLFLEWLRDFQTKHYVWGGFCRRLSRVRREVRRQGSGALGSQEVLRSSLLELPRGTPTTSRINTRCRRAGGRSMELVLKASES